MQGLKCMTNFLPAGIINDRLNDICRLAGELQELLAPGKDSEVAEYLGQLQDAAQEVLDLIQSFSCQPLIYTGKGTTEEVITRLEWLLAFSELDQEQLPLGNRKKRRRRKVASGY